MKKYMKALSGEILCKEITSYEDIDDELVGHPDKIYNNEDQQHRINWLISELKANKADKLIMDVGTACGYVLNKIDGDIGIDIRSDRLLVAKRKYPNKNFYYGNIFNLEPFYNTGIKTIIAAEILEHLPYSLAHHALVHCLNTAPIVYYTVPNAEKDAKAADSHDHLWSPTYYNLKILFDLTGKFINIIYEIKDIDSFLCGTVRKVEPDGVGYE